MDGKILDLFGDSSVTHDQTAESDHCAVLIKLQQNAVLQGQWCERPFQYENMWNWHEMYDDTTSSAWASGDASLLAIHYSFWAAACAYKLGMGAIRLHL